MSRARTRTVKAAEARRNSETSVKASAKKTTQTSRKTMADYAMPPERLARWLQARAAEPLPRRPKATSLFMLDGFVTAIVVGPVSLPPPDWVCPLLGLEPDAFNHDTEDFAAIAAVGMHHNKVSESLSDHPDQFAPMFERRPDGEIDVTSWCAGFYAAMRPHLLLWSPLLQSAIGQAMLAPIVGHCVDPTGRPSLSLSAVASIKSALIDDPLNDIPKAAEAIRQYWMPRRYGRA